ncbi:MAG: hypothetical protein ACREX0_07370 [Noviherbaspirillum sp.]
MSRIRVGDTVAFRRDIARQCASPENVVAVRGTVTEIVGGWLFLTDTAGCKRVMPATTMTKVAPNGVILELV